MRLLRSTLLDGAGTRHGFTTRQGGVSTGRHASLNLGRSWGDDPAHVDENRRLVAAEAGFDLARLHTAKQVHGATCLRVGEHGATDGRDAGAADVAPPHADGLVATDAGSTVAVFTADCVPLLLADGAGRVAAVHAGWRGTVARIAVAAVEALVAAGADRSRVVAAIGPSIGPCCFEVGEEVAAQFTALLPDEPGVVLRDRGPKPHVDLRRANRALLRRAGLDDARIDDVAPCTFCDAERFFSFRRDGAGIGQMLSFAVAGATTS